MKKTLSLILTAAAASAMPASAFVVAGWDTFSGTGAAAAVDAPVVTSGVTASFVSTTEQLDWNTGDDRGASNDGTWGTYGGPPSADPTVAVGQNLELPNATTGGTLTFSITNSSGADIELRAFHFDSYAFRPKAARAYELSVLAGGGITDGIVYTSTDDEITHVGGANANDAHDQIDHSLTGLADNVLANGESVEFLLAFSSGVGDGAGGHDLWVDNIAVSAVPEPTSSLLALLGGGFFFLRRRR